MKTTKISSREKKKQIEIGKTTSYYSAVFNGWITTRIEGDKSILVLSVSAIGLLFTILAAIRIEGYFILTLFAIALSSFLASAIVTIIVFNKNSDLLEAIALDKDVKSEDRSLKILDKIKSSFFFLGLLITLMLGILLALQKIEGVNMPKQHSNKTTNVNKTKKPVRKSLQGFQNMKPSSGSNQSSSNSGNSTGKKN